jgi:hypothetical protein
VSTCIAVVVSNDYLPGSCVCSTTANVTGYGATPPSRGKALTRPSVVAQSSELEWLPSARLSASTGLPLAQLIFIRTSESLLSNLTSSVLPLTDESSNR